jgi:hypothetical protein
VVVNLAIGCQSILVLTGRKHPDISSGMSLQLREHRHTDGRYTFIVSDGDRTVLKARPVISGGYIVRGYGVSLLDKHPNPTHPNSFGIIDPERAHCKNISHVRRLVNRFMKVEGA